MRRRLCLILCAAGIFLMGASVQAQTVSGDALFVTGLESRYKAFNQAILLWHWGRLAVEGGMGVATWRVRGCNIFGCWWNWFTYPTLLFRVRTLLLDLPQIELYNISWMAASITHDESIFPIFRYVHFFSTIALAFRLSPALSVYAQLGFPIGWGSIPTSIGIGFSLQLGGALEEEGGGRGEEETTPESEDQHR